MYAYGDALRSIFDRVEKGVGGKAAWVTGREALTPSARALRLEHRDDRRRATTPLRRSIRQEGINECQCL